MRVTDAHWCLVPTASQVQLSAVADIGWLHYALLDR